MVKLRRYLDAHCHLHEFSDEEIESFQNLEVTVVAVSDDLPSSRRTLDISKRFDWIIPALGLHPWEVSPESIADAEEIAKLIESNIDRVRIVGEVGLDAKFKPETIAYQREVFKLFVELARGLGLGMSVHSVNTWREVLEILHRNDIRAAVFHWYTGPLELLEEIRDCGYMISINPAIRIQDRHRKVVERAPLDMILIESDAPYNYRGLRLHPSMVPEVVEKIAEVKGMGVDEVMDALRRNSAEFLRSCGIMVS